MSTLGDTPSTLCNTNNVGYKLICQTCSEKGKDKVYEGETARSGRTRGTEHLRDFLNKRESSVLYKHKLMEHPHENIKFGMEITKPFRDALTRQANEAIAIESRSKYQLLNSKS